MRDYLVSFLHGLAFLGVWLLNVVAYETIGLMIWMVITWFLYKTSLSESRADYLMKRSGLLIAFLVILLSILCCFVKWLRIIPFPVFS